MILRRWCSSLVLSASFFMPLLTHALGVEGLQRQSALNQPTRAGVALRSVKKVAPRIYGPVRPNEHLWRIAQQVRSDHRVALSQVMVSLVKANPRAFLYQNVNGLKAGYFLKIPTAQAMHTVSQIQAQRHVFADDQIWHRVSVTKSPAARPFLSSSTVHLLVQRETPHIPLSPRPTGQKLARASGLGPLLHLTSTDSETKREISPLLAATTLPFSHLEQALHSELAVSMETVRATEQRNTVLKGEVSDLQQQNQQLAVQVRARRQDIAALREQVTKLNSLLERQAIAGQTQTWGGQQAMKALFSDQRALVPLLLFLFATVGLITVAMWRRWSALLQPLRPSKVSFSTTKTLLDRPLVSNAVIKGETRSPGVIEAECLSPAQGNAVDLDPLTDEHDLRHRAALDDLSGEDAIASKLDLATVYVSMNHKVGARALLREVAKKGTLEQQAEAKDLLQAL